MSLFSASYHIASVDQQIFKRSVSYGLSTCMCTVGKQTKQTEDCSFFMNTCILLLWIFVRHGHRLILTAAHCVRSAKTLNNSRSAFPEDFEKLGLNFTAFPNTYVKFGNLLVPLLSSHLYSLARPSIVMPLCGHQDNIRNASSCISNVFSILTEVSNGWYSLPSERDGYSWTHFGPVLHCHTRSIIIFLFLQ